MALQARGQKDGEAGARQARSSLTPSAYGAVADLQRARLLSAVAVASAELGVARFTVADLVLRSGVSRRTFYELFRDRDDCLLIAVEDGFGRAAARMALAWRSQTHWRGAVRAALAALLAFLDEDQAVGRLLVVDALGAGPDALARRAELMRAAVDAIDRGRLQSRTSRGLSKVTAEGVVGAIVSIVHARMLMGDREALSALLGELTAIAVLPYLGPAAAAAEIGRPLPKQAPSVAPGTDGDPLRELGMRLTRRTVAVIAAIGEHPGASNRAIAERVGIHDQGQVSKLLTRLARAELVDNDAVGRTRGAPNAWRLTAKGLRFERAIRRQTGFKG
ncbi:MAG TPA: hypothetical protein VGF95_15490 [Solirubrobacteraceae bacterium]|jgi:AcrR family transcriptional regulator